MSAPTKRLNRVAGIKPETRADKNKGKNEPLSLRRSRSDSAIPLLNRLLKIFDFDKLRARLERTGRTIVLGEYLLLCLVLGFSSYLFYTGVMGMTGVRGGGAAALTGWFFPYVVTGRMGKKRMGKFLKLFPEAIDTMCRGLRSGLPISESMAAVAREMPNPIGLEFSRITDGVRLGKSTEQAMWEVARRIDTPEFRFMIIAMAIQRETGGNLAETLGNLADLLRKRRQLRLKIRAMSSEARASAMIIGSLPFLLFLIMLAVNKEYMMQMINTPRGNRLLYIAGGLMGTGFGVMSRMIRFEL